MPRISFKWSLKDLVIVLIIAALYFFAAKIGLKYASVNASTTAIWPPTGIALATLLIFGYRFWPGIFWGSFFC